MSAAPRAASDELLVSEIFGPTVQGEGPATGRTAAFLRLGGCNLTCTWCDTPYTWDAHRYDLARELAPQALDAVAIRLLATGAGLVVVSGGEPLLQIRPLGALITRLKADGLDVHLETNGTVSAQPIATEVDQFVVSPKTANSNVRMSARYRPDVLAEFAAMPHAAFKFVITTPGDLAEVDKIVADLALAPTRVWAMPEGTDAGTWAERARWLAPLATERNWTLGVRLHTLLWGDTRGR